MSTSPAENPVPGVVTFTARGNAALDQLVDALAAECDGSPASIADLLERVLETDIADLAEALTAAQSTSHRAVAEAGPAVETPDEAARRRLGAHTPGAAGGPGTRGVDVGR